MPQQILTSKNKMYIKRNRLKISCVDMAKKIGCSRSVVQRFLRDNGLQAPKELVLFFRSKAMAGRTTSTPVIDKFLKKNFLLLPVNQLAIKTGKSETFITTRLKQLHLKRPIQLIERFKQESRIKAGTVPPNKGKKMPDDVYQRCKATMFKKGQLPVNAIGFTNGDISVRYDRLKDGSKKPYLWVRLDKAQWKMLHVNNWEQINGPVPEDHILVFRDKNSFNCEPTNLELITLQENMQRNSIHNYPDEIKSTVIKLGKLNKKIRYAEKQIK
jgi:hypothetical protein